MTLSWFSWKNRPLWVVILDNTVQWTVGLEYTSLSPSWIILSEYKAIKQITTEPYNVGYKTLSYARHIPWNTTPCHDPSYISFQCIEHRQHGKDNLTITKNEKVASQSAKLSQTWFVRWLWCDMYVAKYDLWDRAITDQYHGGCWWPVASFTKEVNLQLAKCPLKTNGRLANRRLTSLVKEATGIYLMSCICNHHDDVYCLTDITQVLKI